MTLLTTRHDSKLRMPRCRTEPTKPTRNRSETGLANEMGTMDGNEAALKDIVIPGQIGLTALPCLCLCRWDEKYASRLSDTMMVPGEGGDGHEGESCSCGQPLVRGSNGINDSNVDVDSSRRKTLERKLVRKLDVFLLPVLTAMCLLQAIDKSAIGIAKINGIQSSLSLSQTQFNFALSIFQIGLLTFQIPSNILIARVHPGIYLSGTCLLWSVAGLSHAFVRNYAQLLCVRLLLGICDAPFFVGALHLLSSWYTKRELAVRVAIMLVCTVVTLTVLNPVAAGILQGLGGKKGWEGWRWVYFVFGLAGVGVAAVGAVLVPGYPCMRNSTIGSKMKGTWWLSAQEEDCAKARIEEERVNAKTIERRRIWIGLKDATRDVRTWVFALMMMSRKSFEGLFLYELSILKSLHLVSTKHSSLSQDTTTLLLSVGPAAFASVVVLGVAYSSDRYSERTWHIIVPLLFAGVGLTIAAATLDSAARYAAMFLWEAGALAGIAMTWSWVVSTIQETPEKTAVAIAIVNVWAGLGGVFGPFLFRGEDAPAYRMALLVLTGFVLVDIGCVMGIRWLLRRSNRALSEKRVVDGQVNLYDL